jgi:hypothetical protein
MLVYDQQYENTISVVFAHHVHMNAKPILKALHSTECPTGTTMTL